MKNRFFIATLGAMALAFAATANIVDTDCGGYTDGEVYATATYSSGKVMIGGNFTHVNGTSISYIARLNSDCTLDTSFGSYVNGAVDAIAVQSDGKIVIVGNFSLIQGFYSVPGVARLFSDGQYDPLFSPASLNYYPHCVTLQSDGKILIGGHFTYVGGSYNPGIARLNTNGSKDTYNPGVIGGVYSIALHPSDSTTNAGKAYIGGYFDTVNGQSRKNFARIMDNGNLDASFNTSNGPNSVVYAVAAPIVSGSVPMIFLGGDFTSIFGSERLRMAAFTPYGQIHWGFNTTVNAMVRSIVWRPSDGIVTIGGCFTSVNGETRRGAARYATSYSGNLDDWNSGSGAGGSGTPCVRSLNLLTGDETFAGGNFTSWDGGSRPYIARFTADDY